MDTLYINNGFCVCVKFQHDLQQAMLLIRYVCIYTSHEVTKIKIISIKNTKTHSSELNM